MQKAGRNTWLVHPCDRSDVKKLTFAQKLWLPLFLSVTCLTAITAFDAWSLRQVRIEERESDLANNADNVVSLARQYSNLEQQAVLTRDAAQKAVMERIKGMRFGKDGYYTIMTDEPKMLMHPFKPELIGRTLGDFKDANGTLLYQEAVNVARVNGAGFIHYVRPRPGEDRLVPKLTRIASFKPWGWIFLDGVYLDDIDTAFHHLLIRSGAILAAVALMLSVVIAALNRGLQRSLGGEPDDAAEAARRGASGALSVRRSPSWRPRLLNHSAGRHTDWHRSSRHFAWNPTTKSNKALLTTRYRGR
jgi:methyl-accepting chemotaxis protein